MKNNQDLKERAVGGAMWKLAEKLGMQLMQMIIQIVLARLLLPEDYGIIGLLTIFINISDVFILQGFTTALIQKKDADELDYSSVFFANILMSLIIYGVFFWISPVVSKFYKTPQLCNVMRVMSMNIIIGALCAVHNAIVSKNLDFKISFMRNISNTITQGVVGIGMAYLNFGVWSLVGSKIAGTAVGMVILCTTVRWKPKLMFSKKRIRGLFKYSSKVLGTNLLNTIFNNMHSLIIGRFFSTVDVGYYQRGQQIPQAAMTAVDGSMNEVLYPTLSLLQNDSKKLKSTLRRSMKTSIYLILPMLVGLMITAKPMTMILLTEKWLPSVPFMQLTCAITMFWPLSARTHALNAIGRSDITLKLSMISKALTLIMILLCVSKGIYAIMWGTLMASVISFWITSYYVNKYLKYSLKELVDDIKAPICLSIVMAIVVILIGKINMNLILSLILQITIGGASYIMISEILKLEQYMYIKDIAEKMLKRK